MCLQSKHLRGTISNSDTEMNLILNKSFFSLVGLDLNKSMVLVISLLVSFGWYSGLMFQKHIFCLISLLELYKYVTVS